MTADVCACHCPVWQMFGRTIKASIAKDNGRATEFIRRKVYKDKSRCYECGVCTQFLSCCLLHPWVVIAVWVLFLFSN